MIILFTNNDVTFTDNFILYINLTNKFIEILKIITKICFYTNKPEIQ